MIKHWAIVKGNKVDEVIKSNVRPKDGYLMPKDLLGVWEEKVWVQVERQIGEIIITVDEAKKSTVIADRNAAKQQEINDRAAEEQDFLNLKNSLESLRDNDIANQQELKAAIKTLASGVLHLIK